MPINAISQFANFLTVTLTKSESCNYSTSAQSWQVSINVRRIRERTNEAWDFFLHDALLVSCCNKNEGALHLTWKLKQNSNNLPSFTQCTMAMFQWVVQHSEFPTFCQLWKKISLLLSISMIFDSNSPCKSYENEQIHIFHQCWKSKYHRFNQNYFLAPILAVKNTPFTFFAFSPLACQFLSKKLSPNSLGVKKAQCKNLYVFGENWQRNQFPKLTTSWLLFHSCNNFAIVQCLKLCLSCSPPPAGTIFATQPEMLAICEN